MTLQLRPTFSESWYRVKELRLRLRPTAQISRQYYRGDRWYVVRDPASNQFHRLSDAAYRFVGLLDGTLTIGEAWEIVGGQMADDAPTQPEVIQILSQLYAANLVETNISPDAQVLLRRHKRQQQKKLQGRLMNLLFPRIPLWDPDTFLKAWMPAVGPLISVFGVVAWLAVVVGALALVLPEQDKLASSTGNLFGSNDPIVWLLLGLSFVVTKFIHEMGHAFSCRRFGGECHEVGIMFLVLFPCPYVDASTAWGFANKWKRIFVGAAGMIAEIFVAAVAAFVWYFTSTDDLVNQLAYNVMLIASVSTVVFNANPLLRYDGYYILSDYLEIPNLQQKSREYTLGLFRRHLFRVKEQRPLPPKGQRWQLVAFSVTSTIYRIFIGFAIMLMVLFQLPEALKPVGLFMFAGAAATFFVVPVFKLVKYLLTDPELHRKRTGAWLWTGGAVAAVVVIVGLIQFPTYVRADAVVEPKERSFVYAGTGGFVEEVLAADGQRVAAGDVLLRLGNDEVETEYLRTGHMLEAARIDLQRALAGDDPRATAMVEVAEQAVRTYERRLARAREQVEELTVVAPRAGRFVAPRAAMFAGRYMSPGDEIGRVDQADELEAIALVGQRQAQRLAGDVDPSQTEIRLASRPGEVLHATAIHISPYATRQTPSAALTQAGGGDLTPDPQSRDGRGTVESTYKVTFTLANPGDTPNRPAIVTGQRGYTRTPAGQEPLIVQGWRKLMQVVQTNSTPDEGEAAARGM